MSVPEAERGGFAVKASALAAGTVFASAALIGSGATPELSAAPAVHAKDVALTTASDPFNLAGLLNDILINGQPLGGLTLVDLLQDSSQLSAVTMGSLLGDVGLTNGLSTSMTGLLDFLKMGSFSINDLLAPLGISGTTDVSNILTTFDVPINGTETELGNVTVDNLLAMVNPQLSDATTLSQLLTLYPDLGNLTLPPLSILGIPVSTGTLSSLVNDLGFGSDTLGSLGNFTSTTDLSDLATQLGFASTSINDLLGELGTQGGVTLSGTSDLDDILNFLGVGSTTLGDLIPGGLTNSSTLVDLLNDTALFGTIGTETIDQLLGLTAVSGAADLLSAL